MSVSRWLTATVTSAVLTTTHAKIITLEVPGWPGNLPGQHLDIRLTADDGYEAERSYSIASSGTATSIELAVDRIPDGEVSPYLVDEVRIGDQLEVMGPLGTYFVWRADDRSPVQLIAGGSGIVPLLAIIRARAASASSASQMRLLYSVRSPADALYAGEVANLTARGVDARWVYTRTAPKGWRGPVRRLTTEALSALSRRTLKPIRSASCAGPTASSSP